MIAQDPLSLVFIFCFLLGFGFFMVTALLGSHSHGHSNAHASGHAHMSGQAHTGGHGHAHAGSHAAHGRVQVSHAQNRGPLYAHLPTHASGQADTQGQDQHVHFSLFAYLNPTSLGLFLLGFGLFGYFFHNLTKVTVSLSLLFALAGGIVLAMTLLSLLNRIFIGAEGSTELDVVDRTGMLGKVSITIPEKGLGEIIYTSPGGVHKSIPARGLDGQRVTRDQEVVVISYQNGVAEVDTWEHFMQEETNLSQAAPSDDLAQLRTLLDTSGSMEMLMYQEPHKE